MRLSDKGLLEIAEHEGIVPAPYLDSEGNPTFGVGHTKAAGHPDPATMTKNMPTGVNLDRMIDKALRVFEVDAEKYAARVRGAIKVPLNQHQFDALVSLDFNTGAMTWKSSSSYSAQIVQQINSGDMSGDGFMGWVKPAYLQKRRLMELSLFRSGDYNANGDLIPIWETDGNMKLTTIGNHIRGAELLSRMHRNPDDNSSTPKTEPSQRGKSIGFFAFLIRVFRKIWRK